MNYYYFCNKLKKYYKFLFGSYKSILVFCFLTSSLFSYAAHIVGGVVYYQYISGNTYKIFFKIYRDCAGGGAAFDGDPNSQNSGNFYMAVYEDGSTINLFTDSLILDSVHNIDISTSVSNPCLTPDPSICTQEGFYSTTITLPKNNVGYTVMYQRCCRNNSIMNIQALPGGTMPGITIQTYIPATNSYHNNSAVFIKAPPIFVCLNKPFYFNHSAVDADGDVLKYSLTTPLFGASLGMPGSANNSLSNVGSCTWNPPYSLSNVVGGTPVMSIDPNSGLLYCKPDVIGRFVVAVKCDEYRNGVKINSIVRDFQFNVTPTCDIPVADLPYVSGTYDPKTGLAQYSTDCNNKTITFNNISSNADRFLWKFGDPSSGVLDTSTLMNPSHTFNDSGTYLVRLYAYKVVNNVECVDSSRRLVKVYPNIRASFSVSPNPVCKNSLSTFTDLSTSTYGVINNWFWTVNNTYISNQKNPSYLFTNSGIFNVNLVATDFRNCSNDATIPITVLPKPTIIPFSGSICLNQSKTIGCTYQIADQDSIIGYKWTLPDGSIQTTKEITYLATTPGNKNFGLKVTTVNGCSDSIGFSVTINPLPVISCTPNTSICYDKTLQLNASGASTYVWTPSTYLNNNTIANPISSPIYPNPITYTVSGTDVNGCVGTNQTTVSFFTKPFISAGADEDICLNTAPLKYRDSVKLKGQGSFSSITWSPPTGLSNPNILTPIAKPKVNTNYVLTGIDPNGCAIKDTMTVIVLNPSIELINQDTIKLCQYDTIVVNPLDQGTISSYSWSPGYWISNTSIRSPRFYPLQTTDYTLTVSNYCYVKSDVVKLVVISRPDDGIRDRDTMCYGDTFQYNGNNNPSYNWVWSSADTNIRGTRTSNPKIWPPHSSTYYFTITDANNCYKYDSSYVLVNYPPLLSIIKKGKFICEGDSIELIANSDPNTSFKWANSNYLSNDTLRQVWAYTPTTQYVTCVATSRLTFCKTKDSVLVTVQNKINGHVPSPVNFCKGTYVEIPATGGLYYQWYPISNINDTLSDHPQVSPDTSMEYFVIISNDCFLDTLGVNVLVDSLPVIHLTNDTTLFRGESIQLKAQVEAIKVEWSPKDNITNPYQKEVTINVTETTPYIVHAVDSLGCIGYDTIKINVVGKNVSLIPTAFSPNGDGINDRFGIVKAANIKNLEFLKVYNRWGNIVFETNKVNVFWDGTYSGKACESGVYTWVMQIQSYEGELINKSGSVELLR